jgi:hypothetical protein
MISRFPLSRALAIGARSAASRPAATASRQQRAVGLHRMRLVLRVAVGIGLDVVAVESR